MAQGSSRIDCVLPRAAAGLRQTLQRSMPAGVCISRETLELTLELACSRTSRLEKSVCTAGFGATRCSWR